MTMLKTQLISKQITLRSCGKTQIWSVWIWVGNGWVFGNGNGRGYGRSRGYGLEGGGVIGYSVGMGLVGFSSRGHVEL